MEIKPTRPFQYIAFFTVELRTQEGPAFVFIGYDVFQDKVFQLGLERDKRADTVLQNVYRMVDHPFFQDYRGEGFTLLIEEFETLTDQMEKIVNPSGGRVLYNCALTNEVIHSVLASMAQSLGQS
ncbi:MAG: hypothetical protein MUC38_02835 [Cyclobacteriaceae bacterium]|jgi:hypothetical protein|nr:hypothetical protein [Cyclobacteriaceae bacterium]